MAAQLKVLPLEKAPDPEIVEELERLLALAKSGDITGYFIFYRLQTGASEMSHVGFTEEEVVFSAEVMKGRIMQRYR